MNHSEKGIAHDDDMKIRGGEGCRKRFEGLIRDTTNIREPVLLGEGFHPYKLATASDKTKCDLRANSEQLSGIEESGQGMAGAVVAGVHDHELSSEIVAAPELRRGVGIEFNQVVLRP